MATWSQEYVNYVSSTTTSSTGYYRPIQFQVPKTPTKVYTAVEKLSIRVETVCRRARML